MFIHGKTITINFPFVNDDEQIVISPPWIERILYQTFKFFDI